MHICMLNNSRQWPLGGIGKSGCFFTAKSMSTSGYETDVEGNLHRMASLGIFVDKRLVSDDPRFVGWIMRDPIVDTDLNDGESERCPQPSEMLLAGLEGAFAVMARQRATDPKYRGLDSWSVAEYVAVWLDRGARVGQRNQDTMTWVQKGKDDTEEKIAPCRCWERVCLGCDKLRYYVDRAVADSYLETKARVPSGPDDHCPACKKGRTSHGQLQ